MVMFSKINWSREFAKFVRDPSGENLNTLRFQISTSVGKTIEIKPEMELVDRLKKEGIDAATNGPAA
jgi:hypothetical protein